MGAFSLIVVINLLNRVYMDKISGTEDDLFQKAANFVQSKAQSMKTDDLLYLYARYKQSLEGDCSAQAPSFWDLNGKKKYAWKDMAGVKPLQAQQEYVDKVASLFPDWETEASSVGSQGLRLSNFVSKPVMDPSETVDEHSRTIYDWCQAGECNKVSELLISDQNFSVDQIDKDTGMGLIHWASDGGDLNMIRMLVEKFQANVNIQDEDGQTPLHYAVSCEHLEAVKLLLELEADKRVNDKEGVTVVELEVDNEIKDLLQ